MGEETTPPITNVEQFTGPIPESAKTLSPSTEAWIQAALDAGNRADRDLEYAKEVGKRLF